MNQRRLLIVEDDAHTAHALSRLLDQQGHQVHCAASVAQALEAIDRARFDLLIVDLLLPDGTGLDLLAKLGTPRPRAVCVSACATDDDRERCLRAGFAAHLAKPLGFDLLSRTIETLMTQDVMLQRENPRSSAALRPGA